MSQREVTCLGIRIICGYQGFKPPQTGLSGKKPGENADSIPQHEINRSLQDHPARPKGEVALHIARLPAGRYAVRCTRVGYRSNDAYAAYKDLGSPNQLTRPQVALIKQKSSGVPFETQTVAVTFSSPFQLRLPLRENDVNLVTLTKLPGIKLPGTKQAQR